MITREDVATFAPPRDLSLRNPPNWTAILFFACLGGLHFSIALPAFYHARWEGYLSFVLASVFAAAAVAGYFMRYEMAILARERRIRLSNGLGRLRFHRFIPFTDVHAVRLTLTGRGRSRQSRIEVLCDNEDIECPPTQIPRQQALFLAILLGTQLVKVCSEDSDGDENQRALSDGGGRLP
jgi:hypothetical protein